MSESGDLGPTPSQGTVTAVRPAADNIGDWRQAYRKSLINKLQLCRIGLAKMNALYIDLDLENALSALTIQRSLIISLSYLSSHPSLRPLQSLYSSQARSLSLSGQQQPLSAGRDRICRRGLAAYLRRDL